MSNDETFAYVCPACGARYPIDMALWRCECTSHLNIEGGCSVGPDNILSSDPVVSNSLWRYLSALPVLDPASIHPAGEGWTPLVRGEWDGVNVLFKLEFMAPTGSFKDRGAAVMLHCLAERGIPSVLEDSSGNGGAAIAAYAAVNGLSATVLVPADTTAEKIAQIKTYGAEAVVVPGTRQEVADEALRRSAETFYASHNWQPFFIEGTKTLAFELWEQLGFRAPECVVTPLGYGSNVLGLYRGFRQLREAGCVERLPRIYGVQSEAVAPFVRAWTDGASDVTSVPASVTVAQGIASSKPVRGREVLHALRDSGGGCVAVPDVETLRAHGNLGLKGLFVEPTSAAAVAGLSRLLGAGAIHKGETTAVILTGTGLKAAASLAQA